MRVLLRQVRCHFFIVLALSSVLYQGIMVDPVAARPSKEADAGGTKEERTVGSPLEGDGKKYTVEQFSIEYDTPDDRLPAVSQLRKIPVELGRTSQGLVAPREEISVVRGTVGTIADVPHEFYASAIRQICVDIVSELKRRGVLGVYVTVSRDDIDPSTGEDLREDETMLNLVVHTTRVEQVRTVASGDRVAEEDRIDNPVHDPIREHTPVGEGDVLRRDAVNEYIYRLNRHPGRKVDMAVSAGDEAGEAVLDYMVAENKPWIAYAQLTNTGTESTNEWRERFGFSHRQLTGHDDILSVDYVTTAFDEVNALMGSYQIPVKWLYSDFRVYGSWNEYTASEVGRADEAFEGESWQGGAELTWNIFQSGPLFVDFLGGARWEHRRVTNNLFNVEGETDFLLPYLGLELERDTRLARTGVRIDVEHNLAGWADTDAEELPRLGRLDTDKRWTVAHWNAYQSFFLEPILYGKDFKDVETPESSTLAHEMFFELKGQHSFGDRLVPQAQMTAGGMYTVRGYPESAVAGDDVYIARGEYRFHVPRFFKPNSNPPELPLLGSPFRVVPQHTFGYPDWDLQFKAFVDWGRAENVDRLTFEEDEDLLGVGLGVELQILSNLNLQVEWGRAMKELESEGVERGDDEIHFSLTLMY